MSRLAGHSIAVLNRHPLVRRWIVPVVFMTAILYTLFLLRWTPRQSAEMVAVFFAFSLSVAVCGMLLQVGIETYVQRNRRGSHGQSQDTRY